MEMLLNPRETCCTSYNLDTINDLLACKSWNETETVSYFVQNIPPTEEMDGSITFGEARKLSVDVPVEENGKFDVYINDFIGIEVDLNNDKSKLEVTPCTVIHAVSNKLASEDHILRDNMIEADKCLTEGDFDGRKDMSRLDIEYEGIVSKASDT